MGDPRKLRKKYSMPSHPWQKTRIEAESALVKEFGLKNKKEVWKMTSLLKNFTQQAKNLAGGRGEQVEKEKGQLLKRLISLGLVGDNAGLSDVLNITPRDIMERRLQTIVYRLGLTKSQKQARQFIVHCHIFVGTKKITVPSYIVPVKDEKKIGFSPNSKLNDLEHPERITKKKESKKAPKKKTSKSKLRIRIDKNAKR